MKQNQMGVPQETSNLSSTTRVACPQERLPRFAFSRSTKHIFKKRGRPAHRHRRANPKLAQQQSTSASTIDLQTQALPILQSQQTVRPIQFSKNLESTLQHSGSQHPPSNLPQLDTDSAHCQTDSELGDVSVYLASIGEHLFRQQSRCPMPLLLYCGEFDHQARISNLHLIFGFCMRYGFKVETIFLAFSIYHRVAFAAEFQKHSMALQAIASLFVAAKYEEIAIPKVQIFARCGQSQRIDPDDVLKVESEILLHLGFNLSLPTVLQFIDLLRLRYNLDRPVRERLISICYKSLNSLALWQERGSLLAMACLHLLQPELQLGHSRNEELNAELKWRVAELMRVGAGAQTHS